MSSGDYLCREQKAGFLDLKTGVFTEGPYCREQGLLPGFDTVAAPPPRKKKETVDFIADGIISELQNRGLSSDDLMRLGMELLFRTVCEDLDKMPKNLQQQFCVKLIERYFERSHEEVV